MDEIADRIARWTPPADFRPLASAVEGIEVFGPPPDEEGAPEGPVATKCPRCGASTRYDVERAALGCSFCGWTDEQTPPPAVGAAPGAFTREALSQGSVGFGIDRRELGCDSCGAVVALQEDALTATCPFCASSQVAVRAGASAPGLRPQAIGPLAVPADEARRQLSGWLGQGWMHPGDLASVATLERLSAVYVPYWVFSAEIDCAWEAQVGTERTERTYNRSSGEWERETVIDWAWREGRLQLPVHDHLVSGTTRVSARLLSRLQPFDLDALVAYAPTLLAGSLALTYDRGLPDAWDEGHRAMRELGRRACKHDTGSSHVRSMTVSAAFEEESWRHVLLPLWISAYPYGGRTHVVLVNGQTGAIAGSKPVAWGKVKLAIAAMFAPSLICGVLGVGLLVFGVGALLLVLSLFLFGIGAAGSIWVWQLALEHEQD